MAGWGGGPGDWQIVLPPGSPGTPQPPPERPRPRRRVYVAAGVAAAVLAAAVGTYFLRERDGLGRDYLDAIHVEQVATDGRSTYAFEGRNADGSPVRWNPCAPVHWVSHLEQAYPNALADATSAIDKVAAATGLTFVYDGPTDERPQHIRPPYQPALYRDRWAPILVAFVPLALTDIPHSEDTVGVTSPIFVGSKKLGRQIVSAEVVLDSGLNIAGGFNGKTTWGAVLLHELGHAVGLGHVSDPYQLMYPEVLESFGKGGFGEGDLDGLRALGRTAGCIAPLKPQNVKLRG